MFLCFSLISGPLDRSSWRLPFSAWPFFLQIERIPRSPADSINNAVACVAQPWTRGAIEPYRMAASKKLIIRSTSVFVQPSTSKIEARWSDLIVLELLSTQMSQTFKCWLIVEWLIDCKTTRLLPNLYIFASLSSQVEGGEYERRGQGGACVAHNPSGRGTACLNGLLRTRIGIQVGI